MKTLTDSYGEALAVRESEGRLRKLRSFAPLPDSRIQLAGKEYLNFSSNDYLGLSQHPVIKQRSVEYIERFGAGSCASRLTTGNLLVYEALENKLAKLKGTEAALILNTGYQANTSVLPALVSKNATMFCDRLSHASLLNGAINSKAKWKRFPHNDLATLAKYVQQTSGERWIVTESVFSMDGDLAPIDELVQLSANTGTNLFIDEAHATGVFGDNGMGLCTGKAVSVVMGTFGKGLGSFGAYLACSRELREYLINYCAGFIYSTALPPAVLGAIDAALDIVPTLTKERELLQAQASRLRSSLQQLNYDTGNSRCHIIPLLVGEERAALRLSHHLESCGIIAGAIRPPTVADGTARIRISLTVNHTDHDIDCLISALKSWKRYG